MEETTHAETSPVQSDQRMARVSRAGSAMSDKPVRHVIQISSPDVSKLGSVIVLDLADEDEAIKVAQKLARETGRRVTVRDATFVLIKTIPATSVH
jgi:hypothetical protein